MATPNEMPKTGQRIAAVNVMPLPASVRAQDTTGAALARMDAAGVDLIPVVDEAGEFAGLVLRGGVERGCRGMGHDPDTCLVLNHLKRNVRSLEVGEALDRFGATTAREPVVVLAAGRQPIGVLKLAG